ncbi:TPA: hypothetical protein DDW35_10140 [Candidatus Sumerlaeota bacterium]|nr:hypothetical protein [Candidatus Sumerlaeota bacterium]
MSLTDQQQQQIDGIIAHLDDFLDKRFDQAIRVMPRLAAAESDIRWHQVATIRQILEEAKGFGPERISVCHLLCSPDEEKKRALFSPVNQVSLLNEIIPADDESKKDSHSGGSTGTQLEIRNVKLFYKALDPTLDRIIVLLQTWIWWDLRDAAELYRFDMQEYRIQSLITRQLDARVIEYYRQEMNAKAGVEIARTDILRFELGRTKEIIDYFQHARTQEKGFQVVVVSEERSGSTEADTTCVRLAKRIMAIDKMRAQKDEELDGQLKAYYAAQMGVPPEQMTRETAVDYEEMLARRDRQALTDYLVSGCQMGKTSNYKKLKEEDMKVRFEALCNAAGVVVQTTAVAAPQPEMQQPAAPVAAPQPTLQQPSQSSLPLMEF